jgi:CDP-glucose 4,6-dehydratase
VSGAAGATVLLTGAQGFVGSWLAERLLEQGARVVVPRRDVPAESRFRQEGIEERCDVVQADLSELDALLRLLAEYEVSQVFHLAAQAIVGTAARAPLATFEANVRGTYTLLEACRLASGVQRIVVASSDKAYGRAEQLPYREDTPLRPVWPYDVSKAAADLIARSYAATYELPLAVTRLANVYGGGDLNWSRIVPDSCRALVRGERPVIRSDGTPERDYLYVDDAVDAYLAVAASLERPELHGRAWNAGSDSPLAVLDLVRRLTAASGRDLEPDVRGEGTPRGEIDRQYLDSTAIRDELGWEPRVGLDEGLRRTWDWYRARLGG